MVTARPPVCGRGPPRPEEHRGGSCPASGVRGAPTVMRKFLKGQGRAKGTAAKAAAGSLREEWQAGLVRMLNGGWWET